MRSKRGSKIGRQRQDRDRNRDTTHEVLTLEVAKISEVKTCVRSGEEGGVSRNQLQLDKLQRSVKDATQLLYYLNLYTNSKLNL